MAADIVTGRPAVVAGGANMDIKAHCQHRAVPGTSNPGKTVPSPGGVARNIAEGMARLGSDVALLSAVGHDPFGDELLAVTLAAGVRVTHLHRSDHPTGTYTAVLDSDGELVVAVSDMAAIDHLAPDDLPEADRLIAAAGLVVIDGNLAPATAAHLVSLAARHDVPVILDPVSAPKAARHRALADSGRPLFAVTPDLAELAALTGTTINTDDKAADAVVTLHELGVRHVWARFGAAGSLFSTAGKGGVRLTALPTTVVDITGAGDAMLAAFADGLLDGLSPIDAARRGQAAAALTVADPRTVRPDLSRELLDEVTAVGAYGSGRPPLVAVRPKPLQEPK